MPSARAVDLNSVPIERLFSAGELDSFRDWMYTGGGTNAEAFCAGQIAGNNAG